MRIVRLASATLALAAIAGLSLSPAFAATTGITIPMKALNNSGENGTATLTDTTDGVKVEVSLKNAPATAQPTHIHIGTCGHIKAAPEYALVNTVNGTSTSVVKGVSLDDLLKGHYAINVHKSADDLGTYVSCGDIKAS